ncbi:hypothetical protein [Streptomyces chattanoogensis]|uniref:hypothetical protein n=1 Tax=Streptomyces chattanoogensis TaxID=66876 RepID=UPI0012FF3962|nr:hypothetical protein [Streptomyces chattanoogensis]
MTKIALCCILLGAGVFGFLEFFTKGLDRLPAKVCHGAVDREIAASALPDTRKAYEGGKSDPSGETFTSTCYVKTSSNFISEGSIISGEAELGDATSTSWSNRFTASGNGKKFEASSGGIKAISYPERSSIYVPCTPPGKKKEQARQAYALIVEARTIGETRVTGTPLRQAITDFAYQLARHAYKVGECQEPRKFPAELPRLH